MSLGGKQNTTQKVDPDLKAAALAQLEMAKKVAQLGFVPYTGATVAGLQPSQVAAMNNTDLGAAAFGLGTAGPPVTGDLRSYDLYQQAVANMSPGQRAFIDSMFINPMTGAKPTLSFSPAPPPPKPTSTTSQYYTGSGGGSSYTPTSTSGKTGTVTSGTTYNKSNLYGSGLVGGLLGMFSDPKTSTSTTTKTAAYSSTRV